MATKAYSMRLSSLVLGCVLLALVGCDQYLDLLTGGTDQEAQTAVFAVAGGVCAADGTLITTALPVVVRNLTTGVEKNTSTGMEAGPGHYSVVFMDIDGNRAACVGDEIEVWMPEDAASSEAVTYVVTAEDIRLGRAIVDITAKLPEKVVSSAIFAVGGVVLEADGQTPVSDALTVRISNLTTGKTQVTSTGGVAGVGRYAIAFIDTSSNRAAASGDVLEVNVLDAGDQPMGEPLVHTVTDEELRYGRAIVNITLR